eukprot:Anaeramoba_ignava/a220547_15.p1 GENE.a220547_15~~a220547_15.p1  ORF type:complete len:519 (-),score=23.39 a220547_15:129-1685(-)
MRKRLSTSIYTFESIIEQNCMYVDKTEYIYRLVGEPEGQFFLSRPRRFGKSLTLSTIKAVFQGKKELFRGLYIYDQSYDWKKHPVIHISMNRVSANANVELIEKLTWLLTREFKNIEIKPSSSNPSILFQELIEELYKRHGKVVVLIDEYDKPILDNILNQEEVVKIRDFLKGFYGIIKACESMLRFSFITGVSKFSKVSIFSDLNNLTDISITPDYATLCGFTQTECEYYFSEWIAENTEKLCMSRKAYLDKLKEYYNGIRFSEKDSLVYNPVSFTNAMKEANFKNHWFETGTPTFLLKLLKENEYNTCEFEGLKLKSASFSSYEVDKLQPEALLYQTGYLTIKDYNPDTNVYTLSYPNREVRESFIERLVDYFTIVNSARLPSLLDDFVGAMAQNDFDEAFAVLNTFYAKIDNSIKIKHEKYYQTVFYLFFSLLGYRINVEVNTNKGRMDAVITTDSNIFIFEFKLDKSAQEAIEQIKSREYFQKFGKECKKLVLIGVSFTSETGEIKDHLIEEVR